MTPEPAHVPLGNSVTATRWAEIFRQLQHEVAIVNTWTGEDCDLLIGLHANRSQNSIELFRRRHASRPLIVALTGTDLYRDLRTSNKGRESLLMATHIVALQEAALDELDEAARAKTTVIYQSAVRPIQRDPLSNSFFDVCVISHMRLLKDPLRAAYAIRLLRPESQIRVTHIGRSLEPQWPDWATEEERTNPRYRWIGEQSHEITMRTLSASRLLVLTSTMEGGANVIAEAVVCGVPALCSDIPGNVGMLGPDYPGYFRLQDTAHLADLLHRAESDTGFMQTLHDCIRKIQYRFSPEQEFSSWKQLLDRV